MSRQSIRYVQVPHIGKPYSSVDVLCCVFAISPVCPQQRLRPSFRTLHSSPSLAVNVRQKIIRRPQERARRKQISRYREAQDDINLFRRWPRLLRKDGVEHRSDSDGPSNSQKGIFTIKEINGNSKLKHRNLVPSFKTGNGRAPSSQDIDINDLRATLEAHRATNRASIIKKYYAEAAHEPDYVRPDIRYTTSRLSEGRIHRDNIEEEEGYNPLVVDKMTKDLESRNRVLQNRRRRTKKRERELFLGPGKVLKPKQSELDDQDHMADGAYNLRQLQYPWLENGCSEKNEGFSRLHAEIKAFEEYISPTVTEKSIRKAVIESVHTFVSTPLPNNPLEVYGSSVTNLALPTSDIDMTLRSSEVQVDALARGPSLTRPEMNKVSRQLLNKIKRTLVLSRDFTNTVYIDARIPLVKTEHCHSGLIISFTTLVHFETSQEYVKDYMAEYTALRPLYFLIKTALEMRALQSAQDGGLASYTISMMVAASLKRFGSFSKDKEYLGIQLLRFLDFFGTLKTTEVGVGVDPPWIFEKRFHSKPTSEEKEILMTDPILYGQHRISKTHSNQPWLLCLQDPANPLNDLGRLSFKIREIQLFFNEAARLIRQRVERYDQGLEKYDGQGLLGALVGANYKIFENGRKKLVNGMTGKAYQR
ncbi:MAG: hypothetical protein M1827_001757 [Pycnora praestabilis]|nr:MAG: hypothetical protein M1827_001757 [Pycnora praestabilis]